MKRCLLVVAAVSAGLGGDSRIARGAETPNVLFIADRRPEPLGRPPGAESADEDAEHRPAGAAGRDVHAGPTAPRRRAIRRGRRSCRGCGRAPRAATEQRRTGGRGSAKTSCSTRNSPARAIASTARGRSITGPRTAAASGTDYFPGKGSMRAASRRQGRRRGRHQVLPAGQQRRGDARLRRRQLRPRAARGEERQAVLPRRRTASSRTCRWNVPKKWFDMFPLDTIELPPHREDDLDDVPPAGVRMARPEGRPREDRSQSGRWKEAVQAYLATIAFCDAQVGRLLDGAGRSRRIATTRSSVLWSDHGWQPRREVALAEVRPLGGGDARTASSGRSPA